LIDTGASGTCVDTTLLAPLGLTPTGSVPVQTPSTNGVPVQCPQYDVMLIIPGAGGVPLTFQAFPVLCTDFSTQGISGLIGRDVLALCSLFYNGVTGQYNLSF
jgi:hypothetical protein